MIHLKLTWICDDDVLYISEQGGEYKTIWTYQNIVDVEWMQMMREGVQNVKTEAEN